MKKLNSITESELRQAQSEATDWGAVMGHVGLSLDKPPKYAFTAQQFAERTGFAHASVHGILNRRKESFDTAVFIVGSYRVRYWWLKSPKIEECQKPAGKTGKSSGSRSRKSAGRH